MAYNPNTWAKGDVVTSAKLNNIEQEIAAVPEFLVVTLTRTYNQFEALESVTSDKTFAEIIEAWTAGTPILMHSKNVWNEVETDQGYCLFDITDMDTGSYLKTIRLRFNITLSTLSIETYTLLADGTITVSENAYSLTSTT